ncbi:2TM domain-containing protein [Spirosoma sp. BT702]|uniref:2TM domain-containing protein n=1 Tax=Spirosoma profusum TaxID=2771354 RepID=A0A926XYQ8_9BACT|nr:2TM domain-containing protein [Spirosoma profusum]MBD2703237.1 2TM domain-containing protein [Spirosoma profusum]
MATSQTTPNRDPYLWKQAKARVGFKMHLRTYLIVNAGLWLIWATTTFALRPDDSDVIFPWPVFALFGWGIGLASHYFHVYQRGSERSLIEEEYQKLIGR